MLLPLYREYRESVVATAQGIRRKCGCHCTGNTELWEYRVSGNSFTLISCLWLPRHKKYRESYGNTQRVMATQRELWEYRQSCKSVTLISCLWLPLHWEYRESCGNTERVMGIIIIMYIYHALINTLSAHMICINLNMIFYTHVKHSPTKTIYIKYLKKLKKGTTNTHTLTVAETGS